MKRLSNMAFILLAGLIVLSLACGKPCSGKIVKCKPHPLYLKYFGMYKLGNYWNYEIVGSGLRDSLYVEYFKEAVRELNEKSCEEYAYHVSVMNLTNNPVNNNKLIEIGYNHVNSCDEGEIRFYYKTGNLVLMKLFPQTIFGEYLDILSELTLEGITYSNVLHANIGGQWEYFFAPDVGLIRFILTDTLGEKVVYNLTNYYIQ